MANFFDTLEDRLRAWLSHHPVLYGIIDGIGIVLFWRGIWITADYVSGVISACSISPCSSMSAVTVAWWDGPLSAALGFVMLLVTGVFVSNFIGNEIIITGLRGEKKFSEKVAQEERMEVSTIAEIKEEIMKISEHLNELEQVHRKGKKQD